MKVRSRKSRLVGRKGKPAPNPLNVDPSRTGLLRRQFQAEVRRRFARLRLAVYDLVAVQDVFGLGPPSVQFSLNSFCPTGAGGGVDPSCGAGGPASLHAKATVAATKALAVFKGHYDKATTLPVLKQVRQASAFTKDLTKKLYVSLEGRYGRPQAIAIMASAQVIGWGALGVGAAVGVPLYLPGVSLWGSIPAAALAESYLQAKRGAGALKSRLTVHAEALTPDQIEQAARELVRELERAYIEWLKEHAAEIEASQGPAANAFCPTGPGGGVDPHCRAETTKALRAAKVRAQELIRHVNKTARGNLWDDHFRHLPDSFDPTMRKKLSDLSDRAHGEMGMIRSNPRDKAKAFDAVARQARIYVGRLQHGPLADLSEYSPMKGEFGHVVSMLRGGAGLAERKASAIRSFRPTVNALTVNDAWRFRSDPDKIMAFQQWLQEQIGTDILGERGDDIWQRYVEAGFRKGAGRAFDDTRRRQRLREPGFYTGTKDEFLRSAFGRPVAVEKVKLLAGRVYDDMDGVTDAMEAAMTRTLADGLVQGKSPLDIAGDLVKNVEGIGQARAEMIARTEIIRAHAEGQLLALEELGVEEVGVAVEWSTSGLGTTKKGYPSPCARCAPMKGVVLKLSEAKGRIPLHPNCRCAWIPSVGTSDEFPGQKRSKRSIDAAISRAGSEGAAISRDRPESILNRLTPELLAFGRWVENKRMGGEFFAECPRDPKGHCLPAGTAAVASAKELAEAQAKARDKAKRVPVPTKADIT